MKIYNTILFIILVLSANNSLAQTKELTLQQALHLASKGNRQLQIQMLENNKAAAAVKEAKTFLLPSVALNSSYSVYSERPVIYLRNENNDPKVSDVKVGGRFAFDGYVTASYPIFKPTIQSNIRQAEITEQISKQATQVTGQDLALQISQLYLTALVYKEQRTLLEQSLQRNERALKDSRSLFLQGKNLKTDTLSNYIAVQNLHAAISALDNKLNVLATEIKHLLGFEESVTLAFTDSLSLHVADDKAQVTNAAFAVALENRKDLSIQSLRIDQAKEQLHYERSSFRPELAAVGQYQIQSQADNAKIWDYSLPRTSFVGVRLSMPIYSGNRLKHKIAQSNLTIQQNELGLTDIKSKIQTELVSLNANLREAYNQWNIQKQNVEAAEINYTMMNDRYRFGLSNRLELTDAELALTKAKINHLESVYSIRLIRLQLERAMGTLQLN